MIDIKSAISSQGPIKGKVQRLSAAKPRPVVPPPFVEVKI